MKKIKLYKASSFAYTPFENFENGDIEYMNKNNVFITDELSEADIIISQNQKNLKKYYHLAITGKKFLIWTLEPRFDISFSKKIKKYFGAIEVHIMNIYTEDVFVNNVAIHAKKIKHKLNLFCNDFILKDKKIIALISHYRGVNEPKLIRNGDNIDLIALRTKIALEGHKINILDVYGQGWQDGVAKENSRSGSWNERKKVLMNPYQFNLCFENTAANNYMTEKIWDSIESHCLPIYYAKNTNAYEIFPKNSFLDYSKFKNPKELFDYIKNITNDEYIERMNKCIKAYNNISENHQKIFKASRIQVLDNIINKVREISN